jgi:hypothetical protein
MNFPSTFGPIGPVASWPIRPFGSPSPASLLLPPPAPKQIAQAVAAGRPRAAPKVSHDHLHRRKKIAASPLLHFPIKRCPLPSSIPRSPAPSNQERSSSFNAGHRSHPTSPPRLRPIKGRPTLGEDPHTSNTPSLSPHYTHATAVPPSVHCSLDAFQASVLAKLDCSWHPPSFPRSRQAAVARSGR